MFRVIGVTGMWGATSFYSVSFARVERSVIFKAFHLG